MKPIAILILAISLSTVVGQNFEGTIKWKMTMEITDPEQAANIKEAEKQMSDPAMQAKMAELKKQMENPQMKAMMESNPQMKAMMDKLTSGNMTSVNSMIPTGFQIKTKDGNTLSIMEGGLMGGIQVLYLKDKNQSYQIDRENKTYSPVNSEATGTSNTTVKVTKTSETAKVMNYNCTKYIVEVITENRTLIQNCWATTEIKNIDLTGLANQRMGKGSAMFYKEIEGVPLKMEMEQPEAKITMEVTDITKGTLDKSEFIIPSDYKEVKSLMGR